MKLVSLEASSHKLQIGQRNAKSSGEQNANKLLTAKAGPAKNLGMVVMTKALTLSLNSHKLLLSFSNTFSLYLSNASTNYK